MPARLLRRFVLLLVAALLATSPRTTISAGQEGTAERPPNFVLIFADDLGYGDLGRYGSELIRTPNLDRMADEGVRFTQFYSCACVCTPSRAGLLTGRYQIRSGLTRVLFPRSEGGIADEEITIAEALRDAGYATACIGKWHLGHHPQYLPTRHGFDYYYGIPYSNDMTPTPVLRNEETIEEPAEQDTLTQRYTEEAVRFIRESRDGPFFLYMPHTMPHTPLAASEEFRGRSPRGLYGDVVEEIDWSVGQILETLEELGLDENTLVLFTSDNGPWLIRGEHGGSAGPLRDGKGTVYEGGVREPCVARWPARIPEGLLCEDPAITLDLFPTFVTLAGGEVPDDRAIDGRNIVGLLTGEAEPEERTFYFYRNEDLLALRSGPWKLHLPRQTNQGMRPAELYDLEADIDESENLADEHPEIVEELTRMAREFDAEARATARPVQR